MSLKPSHFFRNWAFCHRLSGYAGIVVCQYVLRDLVCLPNICKGSYLGGLEVGGGLLGTPSPSSLCTRLSCPSARSGCTGIEAHRGSTNPGSTACMAWSCSSSGDVSWAWVLRGRGRKNTRLVLTRVYLAPELTLALQLVRLAEFCLFLLGVLFDKLLFLFWRPKLLLYWFHTMIFFFATKVLYLKGIASLVLNLWTVWRLEQRMIGTGNYIFAVNHRIVILFSFFWGNTTYKNIELTLKICYKIFVFCD